MDIVRAGKKLGGFIHKLKNSEVWNGVTRVNKTVRGLPATLMLEAELEDVKKEIEHSVTELGNITEEL